MQCPVCNIKLNTLQVKEKTVDFCPKCKGTWLDPYELRDFIGFLDSRLNIKPTETPLFEDKDIYQDITEQDKSCPRCNQNMPRFNYGYDTNIFLNKCQICKGIWADGSEILSLAGYFKPDKNAEKVAHGLADAEKKLYYQLQAFLICLLVML